MSFQPMVGKNMKFYRNAGTHAIPIWAEIAEIGDLSVSDLSRGLGELKRRSNNFVKNLPTFINSIAVEFKLIFGLDAATYALIRGYFFSETVVEFAIFSDNIYDALSEGLVLPAVVEQFPWNQALENVSDHDVRLATAYMIESTNEITVSWAAGTTTSTTTTTSTSTTSTTTP